jgi:hypothetical protein
MTTEDREMVATAKIFLRSRFNDRFKDNIYALLPLSALAADDGTKILAGTRSGVWRQMTGGICEAEIRLACGLAEFKAGAFAADELEVEAQFASAVVPFDSVYKSGVRLLGTGHVGEVTMLCRPIQLRCRDGTAVMLRETFGIRFLNPISRAEALVGGLIVSEPQGRPVGIALSFEGASCYCAPLAPFLAERNFDLAISEQISPERIAAEARGQRREIDRIFEQTGLQELIPDEEAA